MGFGDFAMGYLLGQSFSGPNHIPDGNAPYSEWSSQAKKDFQKICDEAYWRAWDKAFKKKTIERLRKHEEGAYLITLEQKPVYPHLSQDDIADLVESGDLTLVCLENGVAAFWTDDGRVEAQEPLYREFMIKLKNAMNKKHRVVC
ncbi:Uncharacterised protein [Helicobacter cinaedi]|uniref:Uncharacterized protein n=1 Tax=Helicobacter cinaedi TaxID=213 RepID=A0A377JTA5_9HELI|nr:hypothetical protein [Helicobacter cinaedi]STP11146.1 Uncharacterised protein [Helicobacter cinaedi]